MAPNIMKMDIKLYIVHKFEILSYRNILFYDLLFRSLLVDDLLSHFEYSTVYIILFLSDIFFLKIKLH